LYFTLNFLCDKPRFTSIQKYGFHTGIKYPQHLKKKKNKKEEEEEEEKKKKKKKKKKEEEEEKKKKNFSVI